LSHVNNSTLETTYPKIINRTTLPKTRNQIERMVESHRTSIFQSNDRDNLKTEIVVNILRMGEFHPEFAQ
jgi:hypothetical protein